MGWSKDPGPTYLAGRLPAVFYFRGIIMELSVFATQLVDYDVRKVIPNEYRLFQVVDLICTLELLITVRLAEEQRIGIRHIMMIS